MASFTQDDRPFSIATESGDDAFLPTGLQGHESISQLFNFRVDLLAPAEKEIAFDRILGQGVTIQIRLPDGEKRYLNGIVKRFTQVARDATSSHFRAEVVPKLWLLTKKIRSRIFQRLSVPDILRAVLSGLDVSYQIHEAFAPRDYCVQYRESDFHFASRLMEEEGIRYFFTHSDSSHQMILRDLSNLHSDISGQSRISYYDLVDGGHRDMSIWSWEKSQEICSVEYTLRDHCFEMPNSNLEAREGTIDSISVGRVNHKLRVGGNDQLEIYDYPGGYAQRFDGVTRNGQPQPRDLEAILSDSQRTVKVRMEQEEVAALEIRGASNCANLMTGHKFTLEDHFDGDGDYLLTHIEHSVQIGDDYLNGDDSEFHYDNHFTCIPATLSYRPQRVTPRPVIAGTQTAVVVGPAGEDIFCDKYGRVKVQFYWDREGKKDANSSCWLRVAQVWAGKGWGAFFWPRIGHEVVVVFEEGDPDQPMVVGSVYNAENMPWFKLPVNSQLSGIKSASVRGSAQQNFNAIVFNDDKGHEHLAIHSERNLSLNSESDKMVNSGRSKGEHVAVANVLTVGKFIPGGGGSGGDSYEEGNPMPSPPPTGVVGLNAVFTYGDSLQASCPLNQQLVIGNNLQMCINPFGLMAGTQLAQSSPQYLQSALGGGMGGSMQFTIGTNAQFTLGQSFEISIGPPKIEIHQPYSKHVAVSILCGMLGAASIAFMIAYDLLKGPNDTSVPDGDPATPAEEYGDHKRVAAVLIFQAASDIMLTLIMGLEAAADSEDWLADNTMAALYEVDAACLNALGEPAVTGDPLLSWGDNWQVLVGGLGAVAAVGASMMLADLK